MGPVFHGEELASPEIEKAIRIQTELHIANDY
jgi:hypothetical protein